MTKLWCLLAVAVVLLLAVPVGTAPLVYSASGCASGCTGAEQDDTADTFTFPFVARSIFIKNDEATGGDGLWIRIDEQTAVASGGDSSSWEIKGAEGFSYYFETDRGPRSVSLVTASGTTAAFRLKAYR